MSDAVNNPIHYTSHPSGIECIQVTEHMSFCLGNAVKYIWRADLKSDAIEDLKKAAWYINREIARRKEAKVAITTELPTELGLYWFRADAGEKWDFRHIGRTIEGSLVVSNEGYWHEPRKGQWIRIPEPHSESEVEG